MNLYLSQNLPKIEHIWTINQGLNLKITSFNWRHVIVILSVAYSVVYCHLTIDITDHLH